MKRIILINACIFLLSTLALAQETRVVQDFESWTTTALKLKVNKKLDLTASANLRLMQNSSVTQQYFAEVGLRYELIDNLKLGIEGRFGQRAWDYDDLRMGNLRRIFFSAQYRIKLNRLSIVPRFAYQNRTLSLNEIDFVGLDNDAHLRTRIELGYNIPNWKLDPELSFELFRHQTANDGPEFSKFRIRLGTDFDIHKKGTLKVFVAYEDELNENYPLQSTIVGVKYSFSAKLKKKKDDD